MERGRRRMGSNLSGGFDLMCKGYNLTVCLQAGLRYTAVMGHYHAYVETR